MYWDIYVQVKGIFAYCPAIRPFYAHKVIYMESILLRKKQTNILVALMDTSQSWYISSLAKAANTTYVHACNFLVECEKLGLTSSEKHGKIKTIKLTEKGKGVAERLSDIYKAISQEEQEAPKPAKEDESKVKQPAQ
jgi:predicted transcriptional regulator